MVEQQNGSTYTQMLYSQMGKTAIMNGQTLQKSFVSLPGGGTAIYNSSGTLAYYRHGDWLGSSRLTTTTSRTVYSDSAYEPFGQQYDVSGTADASFTGQDSDTNSNLYDFTFREFSPSQGRWVSPDPAGVASASPMSPQSWNRYAYVMNNPMVATDPLGLDCVYDEGGGSALIVQGDCFSSTDDGYYVDCDGCLFDSNGHAYNAILDQATGILSFQDSAGSAIYDSNGNAVNIADYGPALGLSESVTVGPGFDPPSDYDTSVNPMTTTKLPNVPAIPLGIFRILNGLRHGIVPGFCTMGICPHSDLHDLIPTCGQVKNTLANIGHAGSVATLAGWTYTSWTGADIPYLAGATVVAAGADVVSWGLDKVPRCK